MWSWFFMRVSGVVMLFIVLFHLLWMHLYIGLDNINYQTIVGRWTGPMGPFWRVFDMSLLVFAFTHGMNGLRWIVEDYVHDRGWRLAINAFLWVLYAFLLIAGGFIIFTFKPMTA